MAMSVEPPLRRLTVDEALRMVDLGIVRAGEPVELLDGVLVEVSPQGPLHAAATTGLAEWLRAAYAGRGHVREEKPLAASTFDLPEPDIAVVAGPASAYTSRHPSGPDALLVVELAWSSQTEDRRKAAIYAAAGVPAYWLVDLAARTLEVRSGLDDGTYLLAQVLGEDDLVTPPALAAAVTVRALLP